MGKDGNYIEEMLEVASGLGSLVTTKIVQEGKEDVAF